MTRFRPQFWPTLFTVPVLLILLGLGCWQIERLHWKEGLIAQRRAALSAPAVPVPDSAEKARGLEFRHVTDAGVFLYDREVLVWATAEDGAGGYEVLTALREADGRNVFVNRGFIPTALKDRSTRQASEVAGTVEVVGLLRLPPASPPSWFVPDNRPALGEWFWIDLRAMAAAERLDDVAPFTIDAAAAPNPGIWPKGGVTRLALPNHHLQYAVTWFSLAVALLVIYVVYHLRRPGSR